MDKHVVKWGSEKWDRPLSLTEKEELLKKISSKAKKCNSFYINILPGAVDFLKETLVNAHIIRITRPDGKIYLLISKYNKSWA